MKSEFTSRWLAITIRAETCRLSLNLAGENRNQKLNQKCVQENQEPEGENTTTLPREPESRALDRKETIHQAETEAT